ncbi:MAG TPA: UDP-glucose/GDP-mannose dehydrogenase family protein [Clostridia bacterium]|nr:UDP-glucose/GDP-mannose dehydrogenase family protein [Clostridia bacterium]
MRIAIIGSGYVGLVAAACFAELGHNVTCVDNDAEKIAALDAGEATIHEEFLPELLARHRGKRLTFTTSLADAVRVSSVIVIAVGTPPADSGESDLSVLESVCHDIAHEVDSFKVVVVKSTVPVGTNQWVRRIMIRYGAPQGSFDVASNPEFLREGSAVTDFLYPDRIIVGSDHERCTMMLQALYEPLTSGRYARRKDAIPPPDEAPIPANLLVSSARSAEIVKHASNAFLAMKISFINAVANICESAGADVQEVCEGMGADARIGPRFLRPGIGYGGSCFPKDLTSFRSVARECGYDFRLLEEVMRINEEQRRAFLRKVRSALWTLKGKRLAVLGLAFKGGTDDIRESPAIAVIQMLLKERCEVIAYDPAATDRARLEFCADAKIRFADSAYDAAKNADALLILTDWEEFGSLDFERLRVELRHPIIIDGRNMYTREALAAQGFSYFSVGRQECVPASTAASASSAVNPANLSPTAKDTTEAA